MKVGKDTKIWHEDKSIILDCIIGDNCVIHAMVWIGNNVLIGDNCKVQSFSFIPDGVSIGDNCFIGPRVTFTNDKYPPSGGKWQKTYVGKNTSIGAGAIILPGIIIGDNVTIGAGTIITKDVPNNVTVRNQLQEITIYK